MKVMKRLKMIILGRYLLTFLSYNCHKANFMQKYKLSWRDISFKDFKVYLFALFKAFIPKKKIKN